MNRKEYNSDSRYRKVLEQMDLLGIMDITTTRQAKNGTVVWKLPIKNEYGGKLIEVASFKTGYVRNQNSAYSNYQLNKQIDGKPEYYKLSNGDYRKYVGKERVLIPLEIDRLEYLISYCLKNYYIKRANEVANGELIPKWKYESYKNEYKNRVNEVNNHQDNYNKAYNNGYAHGLEQGKDKCCEEVADFRTESEAKILILEKEIERIKDLENKLDTIKRIADYERIK